MKKIMSVLVVLVASLNAFAHGEDMPGPHGGYVEMSKNMHVEVNPDKDGSFHIFLLDGNIENPTIKNSSLIATIKSSGKDFKLKCDPMGGTHFHCKPPVNAPKTGQLMLDAKRDTVTADPITYEMVALKPADSKAKGKVEGKHAH